MADLTLRDYQASAVQQLTQRLADGVRRIVIQSPTGSGKTVIAAHAIETIVREGDAPPGDVLFLAHRREIIIQTRDKLIAHGIDSSRIGVIAASVRGRRTPNSTVQVASISTLRNVPRNLWPKARYVFVDECHHAPSTTYTDLLGAYPDAYHVGLSATPWRLDGCGFDGLYDEMIVAAKMHDLIKDGYVAAPRVFSHPNVPDVKGVKIEHGDYATKELSRLVDRRSLIGDIVAHWQHHASQLKTVVFATSVVHARHIVEAFTAAGIAAEELTANTKDRDGVMARVLNGQTQVVVTIDVVSEGWDMPEVKCAILARPTKSLRVYLQSVGRVMRPWNDVTPIVLDHAGNALLFGLPHATRAFSLQGGALRGEHGERVRACPKCNEVVPNDTSTCAGCGFTFAPPNPLPPCEEGELVEVTIAKGLGLDLLIFTVEENERAAFAREAEQRGLDTEQWVHALAVVATGGEWPAPGNVTKSDVGATLTIEPTISERAAFDKAATKRGMSTEMWLYSIARVAADLE